MGKWRPATLPQSTRAEGLTQWVWVHVEARFPQSGPLLGPSRAPPDPAQGRRALVARLLGFEQES